MVGTSTQRRGGGIAHAWGAAACTVAKSCRRGRWRRRAGSPAATAIGVRWASGGGRTFLEEQELHRAPNEQP